MPGQAIDAESVNAKLRALLDDFSAAGTDRERRAAMRRIYEETGQALGLPFDFPPDD